MKYLLLFLLAGSVGTAPHKMVDAGDPATDNVKKDAAAMSRAFINQDYKTFAGYIYPAITRMTGGPDGMATQLTQVTSQMKSQGMTFAGITFGEVSKIEKVGTELQCTLPQHTTIKMPSGRIVSTSTLIAISPDGGRHWTFLDTSNKNMATIKQMLPHLSPAIVIPPEQQPVKYDH